jgi:hypothetical protein
LYFNLLDLPKISRVSIDRLWKRYVHLAESSLQYLVEEDCASFNLEFLGKLFNYFAAKGSKGQKGKKGSFGDSSGSDSSTDGRDQDTVPDMPKTTKALFKLYPDIYYPNVQENLPAKLTAPPKESEQVKIYLKGILWTLNMFKTGECSDYFFTYRWTTAPSMSQIAKFCLEKPKSTNYEATLSFLQSHAVTLPISTIAPLTKYVCAAMVCFVM